MEPNSKFLQLVEQRRAQKAAQETEVPFEFPQEDLLTAEDVAGFERTEEDNTIDALISQLGVIGAYKKYIGKSNPKPGRKKESIMISCPMPGHADRNPSAWLNSEKDTWYCGACQRGGDVYDLAAIGLGFDVNNYKSGKTFGELKRAMAESLGYSVYKAVGDKAERVFKDDGSNAPDPDSRATQQDSAPGPVVTPTDTAKPTRPEPIPPAPGREDDNRLSMRLTEEVLREARGEEPEEERETDEEYERRLEERLKDSQYSLNWKEIVKEDTFLDVYMKACTQDYNVEEYHFWQGLIALGMAVGRDAYLVDQPNVYGNLFVCLLGGSGSGKSKSKRYLDEVLQDQLPFDYTSDAPRGAKDIPTPNSSEYLIEQFSHPVYENDSNGKRYIKEYASVRGIIQFAELGSLMQVANRKGSELGFRIMDFYDCKDRISTGSRAAGTTIAERPLASALTTTQPKALHRLLSQADEDSGFLNRWLFVGGRIKPSTFWSRISVDLTEAKKKIDEVHVWSYIERKIVPDEQVEKRANKDMLDTILPDMQRYDPILGRMDLTIKKLCLLFCINEKTEILTLDIYERVMKMYSYIKAFALFRNENLRAETEGNMKDRILMEAVEACYRKTGLWPSLRDLNKAIPANIFEGSNQITRHVTGLCDNEILEAYQPNKNKKGRPTTRYRIVDFVEKSTDND